SRIMKKIYKNYLLAFFLLASFHSARATLVTVAVMDFQFNPPSVTMNVGDSVTWFWQSGTHTTTSTTIPSGAASWNSPIDQTHPVFLYHATVAGSYDYICSFHVSMGMTGHITVLSAAGINEILPAEVLSFKGMNLI